MCCDSLQFRLSGCLYIFKVSFLWTLELFTNIVISVSDLTRITSICINPFSILLFILFVICILSWMLLFVPRNTYILFTTEEGAEEHCQCGAPTLSNQRIFDWLDETFAIRSS